MTTSPDSSENKSSSGVGQSAASSERKVIGLSSRAKNFTSSFLAAVIVLSTFVSLIYGLISYNRPDLVEVILSNKAALFSLLMGILSVLVISGLGISQGLKGDFAEIDKRSRDKFSKAGSSVLGNFLAAAATTFAGGIINVSTGGSTSGDKVRNSPMPPQQFQFHDTAFENYVRIALVDLHRHVELTEDKASKVLDKGLWLMVSGIAFYVFSIVLWQVLANLSSKAGYVMYAGMIACSMTFLVVEFLAAWFFKQYRYYVDAALSCMRVKSAYDKMLMSYYIIREFKSEGDLDRESRVEMLKVLEAEIKWPNHTQSSKGDINHMVEMFGSLNKSLEQLKGIFSVADKKEDKAKV